MFDVVGNRVKYQMCSRGLIPRARVKTIKMTLVIVLGECMSESN